ncbi:MAG TPA: ArsR family transcriptional regulator [Nitrososphaeraceae archaeon]|jgi:DNA-binding transcriptional ArsR family regulator
MQAVYIVDEAKIASVLVDPMRRAILNLLRQKPMTQAQLANELGLSGASLNHHMKILRSKRLVTIAKREVERHRIMQIFFASVAYLFVYDLRSLPKDISRYFYPVSLERARVLISLLMLTEKSFKIDQNPEITNNLPERLSELIVKTAKKYERKSVDSSYERIVFEIYTKAASELMLTNAIN